VISMGARRGTGGAAVLALSLAVAAIAGVPAGGAAAGPAPAERADEGWRAEFEAICAKTQDAMALSAEELRRLVERADALLPALERLPETERKVFTRRLRACRDLYAFVLETKEKR
jgi:hypothetical protein